MAKQQEQKPTAAPEQKPAPKQPEPTRAVNPYLDKVFEYKPFGSENPLKLCARLVLEFMCKPTKKGFKCTVEQAVQFVMLCQARALNPWEGDAFIVGYDSNDGPTFSLITAHNAFLKRAEAHAAFDGMRSGVIVNRAGVLVDLDGDFYIGEDVLVGGWATVYRKDRSIPTVRRAKLASFNTGYSQWAKNPGGMIVKVAEADALRSTFPNTMAGMYAEVEMGPMGIVNGTGGPARTAQERVAGIKGTSPAIANGQAETIPALVIPKAEPVTVAATATGDTSPTQEAEYSKAGDPEADPYTSGEIPAGEMFPETGSVENMR